MKKTTSAFTIVELLIVIVVIGILAAISIVAYTGIQQRANNTATISAVQQVIKAMRLYGIQEGGYPSTSYVCVTTESGCIEGEGATRNGNSTFEGEHGKNRKLTS